ncbi:MAG: hypothetical protein ACR2H0_05140, partial [Candidatus Limnocylindrales bacterium]
SPQFEERLRAALADRDRDWLVDQLVRLTLDAHSLEDLDRAIVMEEKARRRQERLARVAELGLDASKVRGFTADHSAMTRDRAISDGYLDPAAPAKGTDLISPELRTSSGEALLLGAKDILFGLLFGDAATQTRLDRVQQELLTLAMPRAKAGALDFMRAATELAAAGTWQDPASVSNDERADNVLLEVQFGETADEVVGNAIVAALSVINNLEINEQVLYARMINIEESTLIS